MNTKLVIALAAVAAFSGCANVNPNYSRKNGLVHCVGGSMGASMPGEQWVQLERVPFSAICQGDVVVYFNVWLNAQICHRAVRRGQLGGWVTKGDANSFTDCGLVTAENFYGRVPRSSLASR